MIIQTRRLILREMDAEDFPALCDIICDGETMYAYEGALDVSAAQEWLDKQMARYREYGFGLWAAVYRKTGAMIGQCGLTMQPWKDGEILEIGYLFNKAFWHKGYASEAAAACRDYAFWQLKADEVFSIIRKTNIPSQKVAERIGMSIIDEGIRYFRGVEMPHYLYAVKNQNKKEI